jgi:predicted nucleotidyltransferase
MNGTLLDLSEKVDQSVVEAIAIVSMAAERHDIPILIVGAAARDFLLEHACGISSGRATEDVDFGVRVNSWEDYEALVAELESGGFTRDTKKRHRLKAPNSLLIDLVPFGPIAGRDQQIIWPPEDDRRMSVEGFESAMNNAVELLLRSEPRLVVRTASLPGLALLKILSWDDSLPKRAKDGYDFYIIMNTYMETPNIDRLATDARDFVVEPILPLQEIGAHLLGRDMANISDPGIATRVAEILHREQSEEGPLQLLPALMDAAGASTNADEVLSLLRAVERGFLEILQRRRHPDRG